MPVDCSVENFNPCQVKQGRPRKLQRPAESKGALELPGEGKGNKSTENTEMTLLLPSSLSDEPNWGFISGVNVSTSRWFHVGSTGGYR